MVFVPSPSIRRRSCGLSVARSASTVSVSSLFTPSERKATVPGVVLPRLSRIACRARRRSGTSGCGPAAASFSRAVAALAGVASWLRSAVKTVETGTSCASASSTSAWAVSSRRCQSAALAQELSTSSTIGPVASVEVRWLTTGSASARITAAASSMRSSVSHHGLCAGVSSRFSTESRIFSGGKASVCGRGGVSLSSHQITGSDSSANSTAGLAKAKGRAFTIALHAWRGPACRKDTCARRPAPRRRGGRCDD